MNRTFKICIALLFIVLQSATAQKEYYVSTSFHEPADAGLRFIYSTDGYRWDSIEGTWLKPTVGKQKVMRDPSIVRSPDGVFHLVWTSSWKGDKGFGYSHSRDLIHWAEPRFITVMQNEPTVVNVWAPELFYDTEKKQFMIVWASCIPGRFAKGQEDDTNNHRLYYATTKDFTHLSKARLLYDPGFSSIDATILMRAKNDYVMVLKDNTRPNRNLKVSFAKALTGPWSEASPAFTDSFCEGPTVARVGDEYLIYYDAYRKFAFGAARTKDFVHFEDVSSIVRVPKGHKHGTIFKAPAALVEKLKAAAQQKNKKTGPEATL